MLVFVSLVFAAPAWAGGMPWSYQEMMWDKHGNRIPVPGIEMFTFRNRDGSCPAGAAKCIWAESHECIDDIGKKAEAAHAAKWMCINTKGKL